MYQGNAHQPDSAPKSLEQVYAEFGSRPTGLTQTEAQDKLRSEGPNEIVEHKRHPLLQFLAYFWGPIPWMIEVAAALSVVVRHWEDFGIILALLLLNASVGFWQEYKADNAIELLKQRLAPEARVQREGRWQKRASRELVPGDVIRLRLGDIVPADCRLIGGNFLEIDESALTGESLPVVKHVADTAYSGSIARKGEMDALVSATGMKTFFGRTAGLVASTETRSHFQKTIIKIGNTLIVLALILVAVVFAVALYRHESLLTTLQFGLILTVAAIPAALPAVLSVTMAVGAAQLSRREAIVRKLVAIEEMAGMDLLCSDKTGTITANRLEVGRILTYGEAKEADVVLAAAACSRQEDQDPIDDALFRRVESDPDLSSALQNLRTEDFQPFDPVVKRTEAAVVDDQGRRTRCTKGAPQAVLQLIAEHKALQDWLEPRVDELARSGYRALGVAREVNGHWQYVGILGLSDAPRADSAATIATAQKLGVQVRMVTGDHTAIAREIAHQVHLGDRIVPADQIGDLADPQTRQRLEQADGFAQVFPEHKFHIVEALQADGHIVGMTGDGVNDAPALKKADVGIAVEGATDAAKAAADIVLTRPGLSVIVDALKESRKIFQRMNSYAIYRIAETIRVLVFITASILAFNFYPVTAMMIVLLALLNDAPIMAIAYDRVHFGDRPERWQMRTVLGLAVFLGLVGVVASFGILYIGRDVLHLDRNMIQSLIFLKLAVAGHLTIFLARTRGPFWSIRPSAALFWSAVVTKALATLVAVYGWYVAPLGWRLALLVWGYSLAAFFVTDLLKLAVYRWMRSPAKA